ncbi:hypothetical protein CkaCkLH20_09629 [Colletotrichum karsti]|uniref:Uncharacterized protein n=1 Tax=Colletotrichum karsti TaxID=1095194 RepID=A0A9P6I2E9_9PEZI|nr:uncharacterized protein CkaCkLH20_09629 [Colletotrichum karsti]KAF9872766.1 hypothetical protein CkaCkLH20_09629 [Colletotrichum karsti]
MAAAAVDTTSLYQTYQALPHLHEAAQTYEQRSPQAIVEEKMMNLFLKHEVYNELAVILIHRHFDMAENEKLVEFGSVASPWDFPVERPDGSFYGGVVKPRSWIFKAGQMIPYEYGFNEHGAPAVYGDMPNKPAFYAEFDALLQEEGLADLLGLTLLTERKQPGVIKLEKTFGRSNVMFTVPEESLKAAKKDPVVASWEFSPEEGIVGQKKRLACIGCNICAV